MHRTVTAGTLDIAYLESGDPAGWPVVLLHGFPYSPHIFAGVAPRLAGAGARVLVPWLRGYGPTRFRAPETMRSGQQGVLAADLLAFMGALGIDRALLAGHDWGGRAGCILAALWPRRVAGLVSLGGYNIQDIVAAAAPQSPEMEHRLWYQYYFHGARGERALAGNRAALCRHLWRLWSPEWQFTEADFAPSAAGFENPDFVAVVTHSYRHRFALAAGDPAAAEIESRLAAQPPIAVPTVTLDGGADGVAPPAGTADHAVHFTGRHEHRTIPHAGHNLPQENPEAFAAAVLRARALAG